jgi:hypothetical protein
MTRRKAVELIRYADIVALLAADDISAANSESRGITTP